MRAIVVAAGLLAASISAGWATERETDTPRQWFARMVESLRTLSYEGTFVYVSGPRMETLRLRHLVDEQGEREHLISLNGAPREVLRNGAAVTSILPDARAVFTQSKGQPNPFPLALSEAFDHLVKFYSFTLLDSDRIAERESRTIQIKPNDEYRYGYRMWLDHETAIPLRVDLLDEAGYPLERVMFTAFRLLEAGAVPPRQTPVVPEVAALPATEPDQGGALMPWQITGLPEGFSILSHVKEKLPGSYQPVDHVVFSDGLVAVSAYMERMPDRKGLDGLSRMGAFSAFGRQLGDYQVTVVGEVPPRTVELIGRSIAQGAEGR